MRNIIKKCLILVIFALGFALTLTNTSIFAATVVPTDYTTIYTNTNNDVTNEMDNNFGVFKFTNYGARFLKVTLTATSSQSVTYPNGAISVKNSNYQLVEKLDIIGFDAYAINSENSNYLYVFLESSGSYYVEINYNMTNITKLQLNVSVVNTTTSLDNFNYSDSEEITTLFMDSSSGVEEVKQFTIRQATQFNLSVLLNNGQSSAVRIVIFKINSINSEELIVTKVNKLIYDDYSMNVDLIEGTYCIAYFGLSNNKEIDISLTRNITGYGSGVLVPDPDHATNCGSQITVEEEDIIWYNRSYRQNNITEGFTRLIYLDYSAPSLSRLDYYWYSSDEDVAIITDYGTVLALPINTSQKTVKVMAVYKSDMSRCYVKEFVVKNDSNTYLSDPIDIDVNMTVIPTRYTYIDLSDVDVPINILQYYTWSSTSNVSVDGWGRIYANNSALGTTVEIVGTYNYNPKVKIRVSVYSILPTSGFEIEYQPEVWNYDPVQRNTNCFSYAFNSQVGENDNNPFKLQPLNESYGYISQSQIQADTIESYINNTARKYGLTFEAVGKYEKCAPGTYKVALVIAPGQDYHWYRQNPDGTWSHKPGEQPITNLDASGNLIYDPEIANRQYFYLIEYIYGTYILELNYSEFIGFYEVAPLNNMYVNSNNVSDSLMTLSDNYAITSTDYTTIVQGMTYNQVNEIVGEPKCKLGFGLTLYLYELSNGELVTIEYSMNGNELIVININELNLSTD